MIKQPYLADCHIHTHHSPDSAASLQEICERAIAVGLSEIAFTDHAELQSGKEDTLDYPAITKEVRDIAARYEGRLAVRLGVELGQPQDCPRVAKRYSTRYSPDFIIGSIHIMADGGDPYLEDYAQLDCTRYYHQYLDRLFVYARDWDFDVLGHLTYPLRYLHHQLGHTIDLTPFTERFTQLFQLLRDREKGIELNASGFRQSIGEPFPSAQVLSLYRTCGCEIITLGSDAHRAQDVGAGIEQGARLLREIGFSYFTTFEGRRAIMHRL